MARAEWEEAFSGIVFDSIGQRAAELIKEVLHDQKAVQGDEVIVNFANLSEEEKLLVDIGVGAGITAAFEFFVISQQGAKREV